MHEVEFQWQRPDVLSSLKTKNELTNIKPLFSLSIQELYIPKVSLLSLLQDLNIFKI